MTQKKSKDPKSVPTVKEASDTGTLEKSLARANAPKLSTEMKADFENRMARLEAALRRHKAKREQNGK